MTRQVSVRIECVTPRHMPEVLGIEEANFEFPWGPEDFRKMLAQHGILGIVALLPNGKVAGFAIYELLRTRLIVHSMAVHASLHRMKVGTALVEALKHRMFQRASIIAEVRETNLPAQLFLKSLGFRAVSVIEENYEDTGEDAYLFRYPVER